MAQVSFNVPPTGDNSSSSLNRVVTINNLKSIISITTNTGSVSHTRNGDNITINCNGGSYVRSDSYTESMPKSTYERLGSDSFPSSIPWTEGSYTGTLYKSGSSYVVSGSYTPSDSYPKSKSLSVTVYQDWGYDGDSWVKTGGTYCYAANPISHTENGYTGDLYLQGFSGTPPTKTGSGSLGQTATTSTTGSASYSGTITRPASDTRTWEAYYTGTIYGNTYTTYYYKYIVNITYVTRDGKVNRTSSFSLGFPKLGRVSNKKNNF